MIRVIVFFFLSVLVSIEALAAEAFISGDWKFDPVADGELIKTHSDQIGTINETKSGSNYVTVPVVVRKSAGLSERPASAQLIRLEAEVNSIMHREKTKPVQISKRAIEDRGVIEATYGKMGNGFTWVFATARNNKVILLVAVSRSTKPPKEAGEEFFKMAREFTPPE